MQPFSHIDQSDTITAVLIGLLEPGELSGVIKTGTGDASDAAQIEALPLADGQEKGGVPPEHPIQLKQ